MEFKRLFSPKKIGNLEVKNRIIMPALHHLYTPDGFASGRFNEYYWRRAEGGVGLIIVGGCRFDDYGGAVSMMSLQTDAFIPGYREFTDGVHERGGRVGVQLYHAGRYAHGNSIPGGKQALAPSAVYSKFTRETPKEMTVDELQEIIRNWAAGARRAKEAGFDLVEIVGSAGYLISQFLSPLTNLRSDEYGGSWENKTRFAREVVAAVRAAVGPDFPIGIRIAGNDFMVGSNTNTQAVLFGKMMEEAGVDLLDVTGGWHETVVPQLSGDLPEGGFAYLAAGVRDSVNIPVVVSNRIRDPRIAERILALNDADFVGLARPLIADPDWANKVKNGAEDEIRRCVSCNQGCLAKTFFEEPIACIINGECGREELFKEKKAAFPKKLLVVGAGPAGCEFAIRSSRLGHDVTLWDSGKRVGGQLSLVAATPAKREFGQLIDYYETALRHSGVHVELQKTANLENVTGGGFDAVITATGAIPNTLRFADIGDIPVCTAYDILSGDAVAGLNVLVVGGGAVGCETAQFLAREAAPSPEQISFMLEHRSETVETVISMLNTSRRAITVIDIQKTGNGFEPGTGWPVFKDLKRLGVKLLSFSEIKSFTGHSAIVETPAEDGKGRVVLEIPCDTVVTAVGAKSNDELYNRIKETDIPVFNLGDSQKIGKISNATWGAATLALDVGDKPKT